MLVTTVSNPLTSGILPLEVNCLSVPFHILTESVEVLAHTRF